MHKDELPKMECFLHPYAYDDPSYFGESIKKDVDAAVKYFLSNKKNYVFTWETECLVPIFYYEKLHKTDIESTVFNGPSTSDDPELNELKSNCEYLIKQLKANKKLNLSLFLWTIYKTYHYFLKKDSNFVIERPSFCLIKYLLDCGFLFFNNVKFDLIEDDISDCEKGFVRHMCGLLSNDLIHTIINCFPDYYSTNIMFLGYGCHIPGGCSDLTTSMTSFDRFVFGIGDYDYWFDEEISGEEFLMSKLKIEKNYEKCKKEM